MEIHKPAKDNKLHIDMFSAVAFKPEEIEYFIDEIAKRIWNLMLDWNNNYRESTKKEDEKTERPKAKSVKHRRRRGKIIVVNGERMLFNNAISILRAFKIDSRHYDKIQDVANYVNRDNVVEKEAIVMRDIFAKYAHELTFYSAYDFDGKLQTIDLTEKKDD